MDVRPVSLRFEHHREALGIGSSNPRISWSFEGTEPNWTQAGYELEVTGKHADNARPEIYRVPSPDSVLVPWPSKPLDSREAASVRVRAFSSSNAPTSWSDPVTVEAGLLRRADWTCSLIQSPTATQSDPKSPHSSVLFRRPFTTLAHARVSSARLYITSHGVYEVELNGTRVGDHILAPGWTSYKHELAYQTFDITQQTQGGTEHVIGVHVGEGWYAGRLGFLGGACNIWGDKLGIIAQLFVTYEDGTTSSVQTDASWTCKVGSAVVRSEIYNGEYYDARIHEPNWSTADYDTTNHSWHAVVVVDHDASLLRAPDGPPIRRSQEVKPIAARKSPLGKWILDFGQNLVGWVRVRTGDTKPPKDYTLRLVHAEVLENDEVATRPLRAAKATDTVVFDGASMEWEPHFTFHGFRYVQVDQFVSMDGNDGTVVESAAAEDLFEQIDFTAIVIQSDMERSGWFACSEPQLNKLHENIVWSMRGNFVGVPTDCPQRDERLGWTGDLQAFASTACYLYDVHGVLKTWLRGLVLEQTARHGQPDEGVPPLFSPNTLPDTPGLSTAIWGDSIVMVPWDMYQFSGDVDILRNQYEGMRAWLAKGVVREDRGTGGRGTAHGSLLWDGVKSTQLGDWLDPAAPPSEPGNGLTDGLLVANAFLVRTTELMADIAATLDDPAEATRYTSDALALRRAFAAEYITANGRVVSDSQTALALALHFSLLANTEQEEHAAERLVHLIRSKTRFKIGTGFAGTPVLGHALTKMGQTQIFYRMLLHRRCPSWLYPVTMGATTVWERWDSMLPDGSINPGEMTSFNHYAYGAVAHWMHTVIGGLRPLVPGWKRFAVRPIPGGSVTHATQRYESPYGRIELAWKLLESSTRLHLRLVVPPSTAATIELPGQADTREVGCGIHEIEVPYTAPVWPPLPIYAPFTPHDDDEP